MTQNPGHKNSLILGEGMIPSSTCTVRKFIMNFDHWAAAISFRYYEQALKVRTSREICEEQLLRNTLSGSLKICCRFRTNEKRTCHS